MTATRVRIVVVVFVALTLLLGVLMPGTVLRATADGWIGELVLYALITVAAEQFRLAIPGRLPTSSISAAAGLGLAVTTKLDGREFLCSSAEVLLTVLVGQWCGQALLVARGKARLHDLDMALDGAIRLFTVAVAAALARELPLFGGRHLRSRERAGRVGYSPSRLSRSACLPTCSRLRCARSAARRRSSAGGAPWLPTTRVATIPSAPQWPPPAR